MMSVEMAMGRGELRIFSMVLEVALSRVTPPHCQQDSRGTRLDREVNLVAHLGMGAHYIQQFVREVVRMRRA